MKTPRQHSLYIGVLVFEICLCHILLLSSAVGAAGRSDLTYDELAKVPEERIPDVINENRAGVLKICRRIASRADAEIAARITPSSQVDMTVRALEIIGQNSDDSADLAFLQRFFVDVENTLKGVSAMPALQAVIQLKDGISLEEKNRMLRGIASSAMDGYALTSHRLGTDEAAVPVLLRKLDHPDLHIAMDASRALGNLKSSTLVKEMEARLVRDEARFWRGPYDPKILEDAQERGTYDTRFGRAGLYLAVLKKMKTAEARAAAAAALDRWEAIYRNHPQRDEYLTYMHIAKAREELVRTAGEVAASEPPPSEPNREPVLATAPSTPPARKEAPTTLASTPADSASPSIGFLWTCAGAALALLVGLLVFWKRRPS